MSAGLVSVVNNYTHMKNSSWLSAGTGKDGIPYHGMSMTCDLLCPAAMHCKIYETNLAQKGGGTKSTKFHEQVVQSPMPVTRVVPLLIY